MSNWNATFNGAMYASTGVSLSHTRAYSTVDAAGATRGVNAPVYSFERAYASAPRTGDVVVLDGTNTIQRIACGLWTDGSPVILHQRDSGGGRRLNIHVNPSIATDALLANPARSVQFFCDGVVTALNPDRGDTVGRKTGLQDILFGAGVGQGEDAAWINAPTAYQIVGTTPVAVCASAEWNGSVYQVRAFSICWWDDRLAGANKWVLLHRGPTFAAGLDRGQQWQFPQATSLGNPNELWIGVTDYLLNPAGIGGQAVICKFTRTAPGQPFIPGSVRRVLQVNSQGTGEHLHFASVVRHGTSGIAVVIAGGDSGNGVTYVATLPSEDYMAGDDGNFVFTFSTQAAEELTNGSWRLYPKAGGDRAATLGAASFGTGTVSWNNTTKVLSGTPLDIATVGLRVGFYVVVSSGTGITTPQQLLVSAHSGTSMTLPALNVAAGGTDWAGFVCAPQIMHQPVACFQMADGRLYVGCDESTKAGTICNLPTFAPGDRVIRWEAVGDPLTTNLQEWNQFQATGDPGRRNRFYIGKYESSSFDSDASGRVQITDDGRNYASIYAPNIDAMAAVGRHGVLRPQTGDSWMILGRGDRTIAIREPRYVQKARPLIASSPAIRNHLTAGPYTELGSSSPSTYEVIDRVNLPTLVSGHPIPPPPCNGPVLRINTRREYGTVRVMSAATVPTDSRVMVTGWMYNLPTLGNAANAPFVWVGDGTNIGTAIGRTATFSHQRLDGYGWHRITMQAGLPNAWSGGGASTGVNPCPVALSFRTENGFRWQASDVLFVPESIVTGDVEVPAIAPPVAGDVTYTEASSRLNVPISGTAWSCIVRGSIPPHSSDEYTANRNSSRVLFTLSNGTNSARVTLDPTNSRVSVTDGTNTVNCAAPAGQVMHFDRNSQVNIGLALTGTTLTVVASIDGTVFNTATGTFTNMTYDRILSGDASNANGEPFEWWAMEGFASALSDTQLGNEMRDPPPTALPRAKSISLGVGVGVGF
jgi:hypothetical protein